MPQVRDPKTGRYTSGGGSSVGGAAGTNPRVQKAAAVGGGATAGGGSTWKEPADWDEYIANGGKVPASPATAESKSSATSAKPKTHKLADMSPTQIDKTIRDHVYSSKEGASVQVKYKDPYGGVADTVYTKVKPNGWKNSADSKNTYSDGDVYRNTTYSAKYASSIKGATLNLSD